MKTHSFSSTELKFLLFHSICFLAALFSLSKGALLLCLLFILLLGLSMPFLMLATKTSDDLSAASPVASKTETEPSLEAYTVSEPKAVEEPEAAPEAEISIEPEAAKESEAVSEINTVVSEASLILPDCQNEAPVTLNLNAFCEAMMQEFIMLYGISPAQVQILSEEKRIDFSTRGALLTLVTRNLMDNAVKYVKCDPHHVARFTLTLSKQDSSVLMVFRNNTNGVSDAEIPSLTKRNYQGSNRISGTGLGLFQTEAAIHALQGSLQIKSSPGFSTRAFSPAFSTSSFM